MKNFIIAILIAFVASASAFAQAVATITVENNQYVLTLTAPLHNMPEDGNIFRGTPWDIVNNKPIRGVPDLGVAFEGQAGFFFALIFNEKDLTESSPNYFNFSNFQLGGVISGKTIIQKFACPADWINKLKSYGKAKVVFCPIAKVLTGQFAGQTAYLWVKQNDPAVEDPNTVKAHYATVVALQ